MTIRKIHRYLGIALVAFWLAQIASGVAIHFRYEIEDMLLGASPRVVEGKMIDEAISDLSGAGYSVSSIWISGGVEGQLDVYANRNGIDVTARSVHRDAWRIRDDRQVIGDGALWETLKRFHQTLLSGSTGQAVIGLSGAVLSVTILLGLKAGWQHGRQWRSVTSIPHPKTRGRMRVLTWHRLLGYWLSLPLLLIVISGTLLAYADTLKSAIVADEAERTLRTQASGGVAISPGKAVDMTLRAFPGSWFTSIDLPDDDTPWYRVRIHAPGEIARSYGKSEVLIATNGSILRSRHANSVSGSELLVDSLYPIHTGQIGGWPLRLLFCLTGIAALLTMVLASGAWASKFRRKSSPAS